MLQEEHLLLCTVAIASGILIIVLFIISRSLSKVRKRKQKEIQALNSMIEIQEKERRRIAEDMHDQIGPMISALKLKISSIKYMEDTAEVRKTVSEVTRNIDMLMQDVQKIIRNLSPANLEKYGLIQTIKDYKNAIEQTNKIKFEFSHESIEERMKENARINIYRIVSELINNSLKHSDCSLIQLVMKTYESKTMIVYTDNGSNCREGIAVLGMGLNNIESRVISFRGKLYHNKSFADGAFYQITFDNNFLMN